MPDRVLVPPDHTVPVVFTRAQLDWLPWIEPLMVEALTERHLASFVDAARVKSPYFRLLARDPDALEARTRTDKDIFYNPDAGLPRAEPAGDVLLRPEEIHRASGEDDVVPPLRRRDEAVEEPGGRLGAFAAYRETKRLA